MALESAKLNRVILLVDDLEAAIERFSALLGVEFTVLEVPDLDARAAICDGGIELVASLRDGVLPAGARRGNGVLIGVGFRVDDIDGSKTEATRLGLRAVPEFEIGQAGATFRECVFEKESFGDIPIAIEQFEGDSFVRAILGGGEAPSGGEA